MRGSNTATSLLDVLFADPVLNVNTAADAVSANLRTTHRALSLLVEADILTQASAGKRNRIHAAQPVIDLLAALVSLRAPDPHPPHSPRPAR